MLITLIVASITFGLVAQGQKEQISPLKVGMMSAVDIIPFYVASQHGYFEEEGVDVELILFSNGQARQTALQTGTVDGTMTDLISIILSNANGFALFGTLSTDGVFPLLSHVNLETTNTINAGVMQVSVTNYLLDTYLANTHNLNKIYINDIPTRLEALTSNNIDVGIFPEPFASIGALRGLEKIIFKENNIESVDIIAFTQKAIHEKSDQIGAFHRAYNKAVIALGNGEVDGEEILFASIPALPVAIKGTINIPTFTKAHLPSREFVNELINYTNKISGQQINLTYDAIIDKRFLK